MKRNTITNGAILLFFVCTLAFSLMYGPSQRTFTSREVQQTVQSAQEIETIWRSSSVHGRVAVLFTHYLNQTHSGNSFPEIDYLDSAMRQGIVRKVYYIVPDKFWAEISAEQILTPQSPTPPRTTDIGLIQLHEGGRIHIIPFSRYIPEHGFEKTLTVIEQDAWTPQELSRINEYFRTGLLSTDIMVIVGRKLP